MRSSHPISVTGKDGFHATLDPAARASDPDSSLQDSSLTLLRLDDGQELWVPADRLARREDDSYFIDFSREELDRWAAPSHASTEDRTIVPVLEERLDVQKQAVETGRVRVRKVVHESEAVIDEPLLREEARIERVPINRRVDAPIPVRQEGDKTILSLVEEVLVVEKRLMLTEELHISLKRVETREPQRVLLRREEAEIDRIPASPAEEPSE